MHQQRKRRRPLKAGAVAPYGLWRRSDLGRDFLEQEVALEVRLHGRQLSEGTDAGPATSDQRRGARVLHLLALGRIERGARTVDLLVDGGAQDADHVARVGEPGQRLLALRRIGGDAKLLGGRVLDAD